jgi:D-cysteine desulfhydrase
MSTLSSLPRVQLAAVPTPLQRADRLSDAIGAEVWFKRDDLTGLGLGGNKVRALEYLVADALSRQCDCLVTGAGPQSNWAMLAAVAARRSGLDVYLVFYGDPVPAAGNLLLDGLAGADVRFTGQVDRVSVDGAIESLAAQLRASGRRPYALPRGGATPLGAAGYARASAELADQLGEVGLAPGQIWLATGSCGTQAGLVAGARWLGARYAVIGVTVSRPQQECVARVGTLAAGVSDLLGAPRVEPGDVVVLDGYLGPGYGRRSRAGEHATRLVARTEGVFLDPVFGAKAMAALIDASAAHRVPGPVVFLVTGGAPTLFNGHGGREGL